MTASTELRRIAAVGRFASTAAEAVSEVARRTLQTTMSEIDKFDLRDKDALTLHKHGLMTQEAQVTYTADAIS